MTAHAETGGTGTSVADAHDMHDALQELELNAGSSRLLEALQECAVVLSTPFERADRAAIDAQRKFRRLTLAATLCGSAALIVAAFRSALPLALLDTAWVLVAELALLAATGVLVIWGIVSYRRESWLVHRVRAEQLRLLKFSMLTDASWWCGDETLRARWRARLRRRAGEIERLVHEDLVSLSTDERIPELPEAEECDPMEQADVASLLGYYREHRVEAQQRYFRDRAAREHGPLSNPRLLPLAFFLGLVFVLMHALAELTGRDAAGSVLALLAVATPAAWTVVRVYRSAIEAARNASRSRVRSVALARIAEALDQPKSTYHAFFVMRACEHVLETDQQEWLRLMQEAEWYG